MNPDWIEPLAGDLVARTHSEPRWSKSRGSAVATERVTLYGIPVVTARTVQLGPLDPTAAHELFIRHGLVLGEWKVPTRSALYAFWRHNQRLLDDLDHLQDRTRRRDLVVDEETLVDLYRERIPLSVVSVQHFERWWRKKLRTQPDRLTLTHDDLLHRAPDDAGVNPDDFPIAWTSGEVTGPLHYVFDPTASDDGVTARIPLEALPTVTADDFSGVVPGHRRELVTALIRSLPKATRRLLVPAPDVATEIVPTLTAESSLHEELAQALSRRTGVTIRAEDFDLDKVPAHLLPTFEVVDAQGQRLASSKDLAALRRHLAPQVRASIASAAHDFERTGLAAWPEKDFPREITIEVSGRALAGFPALTRETDGSISVRVTESKRAQVAAHRVGVATLLQRLLPSPVKPIVASLDNATKIGLGAGPDESVVSLLDDAVAVSIDALIDEAGGLPWTATGFERLTTHVRGALYATTEAVVHAIAATVLAHADLMAQLDALPLSAPVRPVVDDLRTQAHHLTFKGFVRTTGWPQLAQLPRYYRAMAQRLDRLGGRVDRDRADMLMVQQLTVDWQELAGGADLRDPPSAVLRDIRWQLEELRVSVFSAGLKTQYPVSEKRVISALTKAR